MARRNQHSKEELRAMAIEALADLVEREGVDNFSVRQIAGKLGYTPGMLYHLFVNLDDLILHLNAQTLDALNARIDRAAGDGDPMAVLKSMAFEYLRLAREHTALWQLVFSHRMANQAPVPDWYVDRTRHMFEQVEVQLKDWVPAADQRQRQVMARTLWGSVHGICLLHVENKLNVAGDVAPEAMLESLLDHYLSSCAREGEK